MFLKNERHAQKEKKMHDSIIKPQILFLLAFKSEHNASSIVLDHFKDQAERIKEVKAKIAHITELNIYSN